MEGMIADGADERSEPARTALVAHGARTGAFPVQCLLRAAALYLPPTAARRHSVA
jgi:hypothetical protein